MTAAATAAALCAVVITGDGMPAAIATLAIGLFNSILFPTIFTLTLERSTAGAAATSGFLCMAIVGGAVLPPTVGFTADNVGIATAFVVPGMAYATIALFAYFARRASLSGSANSATQPAHYLGWRVRVSPRGTARGASGSATRVGHQECLATLVQKRD